MKNIHVRDCFNKTDHEIVYVFKEQYCVIFSQTLRIHSLNNKLIKFQSQKTTGKETTNSYESAFVPLPAHPKEGSKSSVSSL
jgi:hypothetical protein